MLNIEYVKEKIKSLIPEEGFFYYEITDSTNTRAIEFAKAEIAKGESRISPKNDKAVFIADGQTRGRGRRGRSFVSESGAGIFITLLFTPKTALDTERITAKAAVALRRAIIKSAGVYTKIKWVNDLYAETPDKKAKKLSGILAEAVTSSEGKITHIAVGMGINVYKNAVSDEISDIATSIEEVSGEKKSREDIIVSLIEEFYGMEEEESVLEEYRASCLTLNSFVTVIPHSGEEYDAWVTEILEDYSLLVETEEGETRRIFSGEVRTKLKNNKQ